MLSHFSRVQLFVTLWTIACQASLSLGFSRQEYWSGSPCPPPRDRPDPGTEPTSLTSPALSGRFFNTQATWEPPSHQLRPPLRNKNTQKSKGFQHRDSSLCSWAWLFRRKLLERDSVQGQGFFGLFVLFFYFKRSLCCQERMGIRCPCSQGLTWCSPGDSHGTGLGASLISVQKPRWLSSLWTMLSTMPPQISVELFCLVPTCICSVL